MPLADRREAPAAVAFTVGPAYVIGGWWFDLWRHGIPSLSYIVTAFMLYLACFAARGWAAGQQNVGRIALSTNGRDSFAWYTARLTPAGPPTRKNT